MSRRSAVLTGSHVAWMLAAFFGVVILANLAMAVVANRSWTGLVVRNGYVESQRFNSVLAAAAEQAARGWLGVLEMRADRLVFVLNRRDGTDIPLVSARIRLERPVGIAGDRTLPLRISEGRAVLDEALAPGLWNARIDAVTKDGARFRLDQRIEVNERQ